MVYHEWASSTKMHYIPDSKVHGANMGPTWVLSSPGGPHVGPMNLAISDTMFIMKLWDDSYAFNN